MCRIAGIVSKIRSDRERILIMRDSMLHGGPDDAGIYEDESLNLSFGFRRLSFQDLSPLGHQPMLDDLGNIVLVFNGEIYNFKNLRQELIGLGFQFKSCSDTEVIINSYLAWGKNCLTRFNGMFALALLDKRTNVLLLARDHAGIKPLYYYLDKNRLFFASEIRAFKQLNEHWPENQDWKKYFLCFGHLPEPITTLEGVVPLPKGTAMEIQLDTFKAVSWKFFQLYFNYTINNTADAAADIRQTLIQSVERHLISDAPIGLFLSGGLDSSLLTVIAKRFIPENLKTLSIVFEDERYSEKYYQDIITKKTGAHHQSFLVSENDFQANLPDIFEAMDQPSNDGINSYFICKHAREYGLKAALSGIGSDEIFGGYPSFNRAGTLGLSRLFPSFMFQATGIFPINRLKKIKFLGLKSALGEYLFNRGFFTPRQVADLLECTEHEVHNCLLSFQQNIPTYTEKLEATERASHAECNIYMQNQLLKDTDSMSMWHGLEVRVPFLDRELIELAYAIHPNVRYDLAHPKHLLIRAFVDVLPEEIWKRPKQGFVFPFGEWMRNPNLLPLAKDRLNGKFNGGKIHWSLYWTYRLSQRHA